MSQSLVKNLLHLIGNTVTRQSPSARQHYIQTQEEHHRQMTFQEELRAFFQRHGVEYDERYVWD